MLKRVIKRLLSSFGIGGSHKIFRLLRRYFGPGESPFVSKISRDPLNAVLHLQNAVAASRGKIPYLAYSELRTARHLGLAQEQFDQYALEFKAALPDLLALDHNTYFRLRSLASQISEKSPVSDYSILDVGGGNGILAAFVPDASYCLAEPTVNGISGTQLPFPDRSFDFVVSCHVLEHIPPANRTLFLDRLLSKASRGLILLNPFEVPGTLPEERLELVVDITGAQWAKEHLEYSLPEVNLIETYCEKNGLQFEIQPNATQTTCLALTFMEYFAAQTGLEKELQKVNSFFNQNYCPIANSEEFPNAYLVYIAAPEAKTHA